MKTREKIELRELAIEARDMKAYQIVGSAEAVLNMAKQAGISFPGMPTLQQLMAEYDQLNEELNQAFA